MSEKGDRAQACWMAIRGALDQFNCTIGAEPVFRLQEDGTYTIDVNMRVVAKETDAGD